MKESELRKIYLSATRLYGFVINGEIYEILDHYKIQYSKTQILNDLRKRYTKKTKYYVVVKVNNNDYAVFDPAYCDENYVKELTHSKANKPIYYPKTYDAFLNYSNPLYVDENELKGMNDIFTFLKRHSSLDDDELTLITEYTIFLLESPSKDGFSKAIKLLEDAKINFENEKVVRKYINIIQNTSNNLRTPFNNGFTPNELLKMAGPIDPNKLALTMGPNMRKSFLDGSLDVYKYLKELEDSAIPEKAKQSIKKELLGIIDEIEKFPKA